jgi:hypothetical protein
MSAPAITGPGVFLNLIHDRVSAARCLTPAGDLDQYHAPAVLTSAMMGLPLKKWSIYLMRLVKPEPLP